MILDNALTSLERRDAHRKGKQKEFVSCWDRCRGECQSQSCCPAGHVQAHSDSTSHLHSPTAQPSPFLFFSTRRGTKLREVSREGKATPRSDFMEEISKGDAGAQHRCPAPPAVPFLQHPHPRLCPVGACGTHIPACQRDRAAAEGCLGQCLACLAATAPVSPIPGAIYPKIHSHGVMDVQGFLCREMKVRIAGWLSSQFGKKWKQRSLSCVFTNVVPLAGAVSLVLPGYRK